LQLSEQASKIRIDKWLWQARFVKTRSLAAKLVTGGHMRVNGTKIAKPAQAIGPGDVLTFPLGQQIRVVRLLAIGTRRGPAPEAQALYEDLTEVKNSVPSAPGYDGKGRPDKRARRQIDLNRNRALE
jgi:ribosome-associated heat shock protein Hsp15